MVERTGWYKSSQTPVRRGLYERDWTNTDVVPIKDRRVHMDLWEPAPGYLKRGIWYVWDGGGINDASEQALPWRGLAHEP